MLICPAAGEDRGERHLHSFGSRVRGDTAVAPVDGIRGRRSGSDWVYIPPDDIRITRGVTGAARIGSKRSVNNTGPRTWVARVISCPSSVSVRVGGSTPALWMSTSNVAHPAGQVGGEGADRVQVGHIAHLHLHIGDPGVGRDDLLARLLTALPVAHGQQDGRAQPGQARGDRLADARG